MRRRLSAGAAPVRFGADFLERLGRLVVRVESVRERREGAGRARLTGAGTEFVGFRPYRPGEDLRRLDWGLYARLQRPFVRVARRESSERWAILLDASASMNVGNPTKLQTACEVATAIAAIGLREGALVELALSGSRDGFRLDKRAGLGPWMRSLEGRVGEGRAGLGSLAAEPQRHRGAGAVFLVGDLFDLEPADVLRLGRRGRDLHALAILAEEELAPRAVGGVRWSDPETGRTLDVELDEATRASYERVVARALEEWGRACARHRVFFGAWPSQAPFDSIAAAPFDA